MLSWIYSKPVFLSHGPLGVFKSSSKVPCGPLRALYFLKSCCFCRFSWTTFMVCHNGSSLLPSGFLNPRFYVGPVAHFMKFCSNDPPPSCFMKLGTMFPQVIDHCRHPNIHGPIAHVDPFYEILQNTSLHRFSCSMLMVGHNNTLLLTSGYSENFSLRFYSMWALYIFFKFCPKYFWSDMPSWICMLWHR